MTGRETAEEQDPLTAARETIRRAAHPNHSMADTIDEEQLGVSVLRALTDEATVEAVARALYEADPHYEGGESIEGFQVTPGGDLSWEQFKDQCDEFGDDRLFHGWGDKLQGHYALARAVILAILTRAKEPTDG